MPETISCIFSTHKLIEWVGSGNLLISFITYDYIDGGYVDDGREIFDEDLDEKPSATGTVVWQTIVHEWQD